MNLANLYCTCQVPLYCMMIDEFLSLIIDKSEPVAFSFQKLTSSFFIMLFWWVSLLI